MKKYFIFLLLLTISNSYTIEDNSQIYEQVTIAIENSDFETVNHLIDKVDVNFQKNGITLLELACFNGHRSIANLLVKNEAIITNYNMVSITEQIELKEKLTTLGLTVNSLGIIEYKDKTKRSLKCNDLFFLRHGNTLATEKKIFTDKDDCIAWLTDNGKKEIKKIVDEINRIKPDVIITSSLTRCKETLDIILECLDKELQKTIEVTTLDAIKSINHGDWEGRKKENLKGQDLLTWFAKWNCYIFAKSPNGESLAELIIRTNQLLDFIDENYQSKKVLVIGHGSVSLALVMLLKILDNPSKDDYKIAYGELKKLY